MNRPYTKESLFTAQLAYFTVRLFKEVSEGSFVVTSVLQKYKQYLASTHWDLNKIVANLQTTFLNALSWMTTIFS